MGDKVYNAAGPELTLAGPGSACLSQDEGGGGPLRYVSKMTNELTLREIHDILAVLNGAFGHWGQEDYFRWKYLDDPYGESMHAIGYDGDDPVGCVAFWRTEVAGRAAYECVDGAVLPSHRNKGIFGTAASACVSRLTGEYMYAYPSEITRPALLKAGLTLERRIPITFHLAPIMLRRYRKVDLIPDKYAKWRFVEHPTNTYYVYRMGGKPFLLIKRRKNLYVAGGRLSSDFGLREVRPLFVFSYDFPDLSFRFPRRAGYFLENFGHGGLGRSIPCYMTDRF